MKEGYCKLAIFYKCNGITKIVIPLTTYSRTALDLGIDYKYEVFVLRVF